MKYLVTFFSIDVMIKNKYTNPTNTLNLDGNVDTEQR